jgi:hypothetical protein
LSSLSLTVARIYQGVFGYAPFQRIYGGQWPVVGFLSGGWVWQGMALLLIVLGMGFGLRWMWLVGVVMMVISVGHAWSVARRRAPPGAGWSWRDRLMLSFLCWAQPVVRGWTRYIGSLGSARGTRAAPDFRNLSWWPRWRLGRMTKKERFWNRRGVGRDELLEALPEMLANSLGGGFVTNTGMGWERWDLEVSRKGVPWVVQVLTVTEYHEAKDRMTRVRLTAVPTSFLMQVALLFLAVLILIVSIPELRGPGLLVWVLLAIFPLSQFVRGRMILGRVNTVLVEAARRFGVVDDRPPEEEGEEE